MAPYCYRVEVAGSVRRQKPEVKDIEIVAHPKTYWVQQQASQTSMFDQDPVSLKKSELVDKCLAELPNVTWMRPGFKDTHKKISTYGKLVFTAVPDLALDMKNELSDRNNFGLDRKYWKGVTWYQDLPVNLDIFLAGADNFGVIYLIRTGPKEFNIRLINALKDRGYQLEGGQIHHGSGRTEFCPDEGHVFSLAGVSFIQPAKRDLYTKNEKTL